MLRLFQTRYYLIWKPDIVNLNQNGLNDEPICTG